MMKRTLLVSAAAALILVLGWAVARRSTATNSPAATVNLGKTTSRSSMSSGSTTSSSGTGSFLAVQRGVLVQATSDSLSRRVGKQLASLLQTNQLIPHLEMRSMEQLTEPAQQAPDVFIILEMVELQEAGVVNQETKVTFHLTLGNSLWQSRSYYHDHSTPPLVNHNWTATLEHESSFTGLRTDAEGTLAQEIATQLFKGLSNHVTELAGKHEALPELPPELYGPYQPVRDFSLLADVKAERVASYYGLLTHNETFWKFDLTNGGFPGLSQLVEKAKEEGWKVEEHGVTNHIRLRQSDEREIEIFPAARKYEEATKATTKPREFIARYRKAFSDQERQAAMEKLISTQPAVDLLIPFENLFSREQKERFYKSIEQAAVLSPKGALRLVAVKLGQKDTNGAVAMLKRAQVLCASMNRSEATEVKNGIKENAKKIAPKGKIDLTLSAEDYTQAGFIELSDISKTIDHERALGEPLLFFAAEPKGIKTLSLLVQKPRGEAYPFQEVQTFQGGRSTSSLGFVPQKDRDWTITSSFAGRQLKLQVEVNPSENKVRYKGEWKK